MDSWAANPCSRKTSPPMSKQKVYCASTAQVWALHDAMPEHLRVADVDFISGVVHPVQKWSNKPLKTDGSAAPIPRFRRTLLYPRVSDLFPTLLHQMVTSGPKNVGCHARRTAGRSRDQ